MPPTPSRSQWSRELVLGSGWGEGLPGRSPSWGCRAYRTLPALALSSVVTRADRPSDPRRGGSLWTKASGDSCSHVANARGSLLDFTSGGRVSLHCHELCDPPTGLQDLLCVRTFPGTISKPREVLSE